MPVKVTRVKTRGGKRFERMVRQAGRGGVTGLDVGFFATARYPNGTPVAAVAAWNEFGTKRIPERPFMRQAIGGAEDGISNVLRAGIDPERGVVDKQLADRVGAFLQGQIQERIIDLEEPPNAPSTVERKKSSNPLVASGTMLGSVTWKAN